MLDGSVGRGIDSLPLMGSAERRFGFYFFFTGVCPRP